MKTRILSILALLLMAVSGAWAQDTYNVTFKANGKTVTKENVTLPWTVKCDYYNSNGDELDKIIQELYELSGGWCGEVPPSSSGSENVMQIMGTSFPCYLDIQTKESLSSTGSDFLRAYFAHHFCAREISKFVMKTLALFDYISYLCTKKREATKNVMDVASFLDK